MKSFKYSTPIKFISSSDLGIIKLCHERVGHDPLVDLVFMHEDDSTNMFTGSFIFDEIGIWTLSYGDRTLNVSVSNTSNTSTLIIE